MAAALSNHSLSFSPRPPSSPPSKPLKTLTLALPARQNPGSKSVAARGSTFSSPSSLSSQLPRVPFRATPAQTDPKTVNGDEENQIFEKSENKEDKKDFLMMKALFQAYKQAILDGEEKSASEMEAAICTLENEKNGLSLKLADLTAEIASGKNKLLRVKADFENFRKRTEKDRLSFSSDIQGEVVESLLPMVDSFEKAKQDLQPRTEKEKKIDESYQGIYKQFVEVMRSLHVAVVETVGKPFNPSIHEAVAREDSEQFKEGIVMQELRRGFVLGDRLLRPASVKVSAGPGPRKVPSGTEKSAELREGAPGPVEDSAAASSSS